jgi:glycosyltransferase involved in cell wall biosynthesis
VHTCIVTLAATSRLHFVRALLQAAATHHPEADRACVAIARDLQEANRLGDEFVVIPVATLDVPDALDLLFRYDSAELPTALLPWMFEHVFSWGYEAVVFLAPHLRLERPLREALSLLETSADVVLLPSVTAPGATVRSSDAATTVTEMLRGGGCSPDFLAIRRTDHTLGLLRWWREAMTLDAQRPGFESTTDAQHWLNLLPTLFERTSILRHPGYNVAAWNVAERRVHLGAYGRLMAGDEPLVCWNVSGLDPQLPERLAVPSGSAEGRALFRQMTGDHARRLMALGAAWYAGHPYEFGVFADGSRVRAEDRKRFRSDVALQQACAGEPFAHPELVRPVVDAAGTSDALASSFAAMSERQRLESLSTQLLGRFPTPEELQAWRPRLRSRPGMARLLLGVGFSREARRMPGWFARLLQYIADASMAAGAVRNYTVMPFLRLLSRAARVVPSLAYRPYVSDTRAIAAEPHPRQVQRHTATRPPADAAKHETVGISILGYFSRENGIGEAARSLARACEVAGIPVSPIDVGPLFETPVSALATAALPRPRQLPIDVLYYNADMTPAAARHLQALGHQSGYRIGVWHWEQPVLPTRFHEAFADVDEVWVPSRFVHEAIAPVAPVPVVTIPHAVDFTPTLGVRRADFGLPDDKCLVLVMYDFHSFQERKNPRAAIAAFRAARAVEPSLGLVVKTNNAGRYPRERQELADMLRDVPDVTVIDASLTRQQAWDLEACCDILLSLHRAEGFGLILAEMMFLGKPVIATGWSANMDFMDASNSIPVAFTLTPLARAVGPYAAGLLWAEPDIDHAAEALRRLASDRDLADRLGRAAHASIRRTLAPLVVGARVRERLDVVRRWFPRAGAVPPDTVR